MCQFTSNKSLKVVPRFARHWTASVGAWLRHFMRRLPLPLSSTLEPNMYPGFELHFEMTMRSFLGAEADHIAEQAHNQKFRKKWYAKTLKKILIQIDQIDTTTNHKESLTTWVECALNATTKEFDEQKILMYLFRLSGALLGFEGIRGSVLYTPIYSQNHNQHYTQEIMRGGDAMKSYYDKENSIAIRIGLVLQLKEEGLSDFKIGQVLNISEYQVKKLRNRL